MLESLPVEDQRRLVYAPLWVFHAVANAEEPAGTAQFRTLVERLERTEGSRVQSLADQAFTVLRDGLDVLWSAFQSDHRGPERGLREVADLLDRQPPTERQTFQTALVDLADAIADASRELGAAPLSDPERVAIHEVAAWLGVPGSDFPVV